jgi:hypothetical protein
MDLCDLPIEVPRHQQLAEQDHTVHLVSTQLRR